MKLAKKKYFELNQIIVTKLINICMNVVYEVIKGHETLCFTNVFHFIVLLL